MYTLTKILIKIINQKLIFACVYDPINVINSFPHPAEQHLRYTRAGITKMSLDFRIHRFIIDAAKK